MTEQRNVDREMTAEPGLFYSARDSKVGHEEGPSYVWTLEQFKPAARC